VGYRNVAVLSEGQMDYGGAGEENHVMSSYKEFAVGGRFIGQRGSSESRTRR